MKKIIILQALFVFLFAVSLNAREKNTERNRISSLLKSNVLVLEKFDGNRISADVENTGQYVSYHRTGDAGLEWPKGSHKTADFAAGIWVAGKVRGTGELRTAAAEYQVEFQPGKIKPDGTPDNPEDPRYKIWKINKTDLFNPSDDYLNWPVEDGAPWEDVNGDGVFTRGVDRPLLLGDQTLWMVFNDANPAQHNIFKTAPMGLEVQMTIWGYNRIDAFGDMFFVKALIINKSNTTYDSTFVALWDDPDLGYAGDDFVGCDTTLSLGFCYNASNTDNVYGSAPPAIGRDFFQGVRVYTGNPNDSAKAFGKWWKGYKNLPMYAFSFYWNGAPFPYRDPNFADEAYNFMKGFLADGTPYVDPNTGQATRYVFPGDPETGTGWLDGTRVGPITLSPGDRRFLMSNGPFTLAPGDTQEIIFGLLIARGTSNVNSVTTLKMVDRVAQLAYDLDFKLPPTPPPPSPNVQIVELDKEIVLYWPYDKRIDEYREVDLIDRDPNGNPTEYVFEGYIIYQFESPIYPPIDTGGVCPPRIVKIAIFDVVNGVTAIRDWVFDPRWGEYIEVTVIRGTDSGIQRFFRVNKDYLKNEPLVNGKTYYFAVTAYAYNPYGVPRVIESPVNIITATPKQIIFTPAVGDIIRSVRKSGKSDGDAFGIIIDPTKLTGHTYEVRFDTAGGEITWKLIDKTTNQLKLTGQRNQSGDGNYEIIDGIQFKVIGPPPGPKDWAWTKGTRKLSWANADIMTYLGFPSHLFTFNGAFGYVSPYGIFVSGHEHSDVVTPDKLRDIKIVFATTDTAGNFDPTHQNASFGYRYLRRASAAPAKPEFAPFIKNPAPGYAFQEFGLDGQPNVPLAVYDIEANPPRRLAVGFLENNVAGGLVDGKYWPGDYNVYDNVDASGPREWLFIFDVDYSTTQSADLSKDILNNDLPVMYMATWNRRGNVAFSDGDELVIYANHPNTVNDIFEITAPSAPVKVGDENNTPLSFELYQNYPNPFNPSTTIEFDIPEKTNVKLIIYDILGREVKKLIDKELDPGKYKVNFDAKDLSSGVYFYTLRTSKFTKTNKMLLIK
jgi:hypothetical protein